MLIFRSVTVLKAFHMHTNEDIKFHHRAESDVQKSGCFRCPDDNNEPSLC